MYNILVFGYEFLSEFIPFFIAPIMLRKVQGRYTSQFTKKYYFLPVIFAFYIMAVFYVTDVGTLYDVMKIQYKDLKDQINLMPFSGKISTIGYLLNIFMFIPFGFLLSVMWEKMRKISYVVLAGLLFSAFIELSQLPSGRSADIDDLILNTIGAVVGFFLYKVWDKVTKSKFQLVVYADIAELPIYILTLFFGRFFLFNRVGLIEKFYGL